MGAAASLGAAVEGTGFSAKRMLFPGKLIAEMLDVGAGWNAR